LSPPRLLAEEGYPTLSCRTTISFSSLFEAESPWARRWNSGTIHCEQSGRPGDSRFPPALSSVSDPATLGHAGPRFARSDAVRSRSRRSTRRRRGLVGPQRRPEAAGGEWRRRRQRQRWRPMQVLKTCCPLIASPIPWRCPGVQSAREWCPANTPRNFPRRSLSSTSPSPHIHLPYVQYIVITAPTWSDG
jgi:hypothetical protein